MNKHTPGPWEWIGTPGESELRGARGCVLYHALYEGLWFCNSDNADRVSNARLIAAAPELLAFAEAYVFTFSDAPVTWKLLELARAAIAKATGEPEYELTPEGRAIAAAYKKRQEEANGHG